MIKSLLPTNHQHLLAAMPVSTTTKPADILYSGLPAGLTIELPEEELTTDLAFQLRVDYRTSRLRAAIRAYRQEIRDHPTVALGFIPELGEPAQSSKDRARSVWWSLQMGAEAVSELRSSMNKVLTMQRWN